VGHLRHDRDHVVVDHGAPLVLPRGDAGEDGGDQDGLGRIRQRILSEFSYEAHSGTHIVKVCVAVAPLFGLLGTVWGMISVFDVMANLGTGNARAMASGVSKSTLPTMAGMVVAVSGIYFAQSLGEHARHAVEELGDELRYH
jgi:biopolymer transport protein ExbB